MVWFLFVLAPSPDQDTGQGGDGNLVQFYLMDGRRDRFTAVIPITSGTDI